MPKLVVKHPEKGDLTFALTGDQITIGRRAENDIQIVHGTISGKHAELISCNGHYLLRDLDSTNHCFIDGIQVSEAELNERCKLILGTLECEYIPDAPMATLATLAPKPSEADTLRKTVGILREQNEELVSKLSEQQKQIDILGSARLLTPAAGADMQALREQVKTLTAERDALTKDNKNLRTQIAALRRDLGLSEDTGTMKATVPVTLPERTSVSVAPDGGTADAAPVAKKAGKSTTTVDQISSLTEQLGGLGKMLVKDPADKAPLNEMLAVAKQLSVCVNPLGDHPAARLAANLESLLEDISGRAEDLEIGALQTVSFAAETLGTILVPEMLKRCKDLPSPSILAIEDDKELLPAITAALEFSQLPTTGCESGDSAMETLRTKHFDLVLLDSTQPETNIRDICSRIRSLPAHERTPVVFLTGCENAAQDGASDVMGKPFNMFELTLKAHTWALKNQLSLS